jgi:eukaryotic-like serine/threonine-protein kinase
MNRDRWPRIKELFHAALEHAPDERARFLRHECDGDETIRAEVQRLLAAHSEAGGFIEQSPVVFSTRPKAVSIPMAGLIMGHYEISTLIGSGGMGSVYAARDVDLGRIVALKIVAGDDQAQALLRREAQQASQLNHPHICTIHEVGASAGQAFFAMEYVKGQTLRELTAQKALPVETALRYGIQVADALAHAHRHGLIHRDLKSANVMVTPDGSAKVLDFGLACGVPPDRVDELTRSKVALASDGQPIAGTLSYMAPELLRGDLADVRSDIWALGVVLYEMVTGRRPFDGATAFELTAGILHQPPAPLSSGVPLALQEIIQRCLTKDRHDRYETASEVRSALETARAQIAGRGASNALSVVTKRVIGRNPAVAVAGAVAIALALAVAWFWTRPIEAPVGPGGGRRPAIAVMAFDNVAGTADTAWLSKGVPTMLLTGLTQTRGLHIVGAQRLHEALKQLGYENLESLDQAQTIEVGRRAGAGVAVVGSIAKSGSELRIDARLEDLSTGRILLAETVRGTDVFGMVDQLAARIREGVGFSDLTGIRPIVDVSTDSLDAYRLYSQGLDAIATVRWDEAQRFLEEAVTIDRGFAEAYLQLAFVDRLVGREASWRDNLGKAAARSERLNERQRLLLEVESARQGGDAERAVRLLDELTAAYPDSDPAYASYIAGQLYGVLGAAHDPPKLVKMLGDAVAARPTSSILRNNYGYALLEAGRYVEAIPEFEEYARLAPREPNPYDSLGEAHLIIGAPEKALDYYSRALTVDPRFVNGHNGRAWALGMLGKYDEATAENPPDFTTKAFILSRMGRYADAINVVNAGLVDGEVKKSFSTQGGFYLLLSRFAFERQNYAAAREQLREAVKAYGQMTAQEQRPYLVLVDYTAGTVDVRQNQLDGAASQLEALKRRYIRELVTENSWAKTLEGDIALAQGRLQEAADAYASGEPPRRMWFSSLALAVSFLTNNLVSRDGLARVHKARGDLPRAIQEYRRLTSGNANWNSMLEPRYVLEIAKLLEATGDRAGALVEYSRFLDLWKQADSDLPELAEARQAVARIRSGAVARY